MPKKRFTPEKIIAKLREAEVLLRQDKTTDEFCRQLEITSNTYILFQMYSNDED